MRLRFGLLDLIGVILVVLVLAMPEPTRRLTPLYEQREYLDLAALPDAQAQVALSPGDGAALLRFVDLLSLAEQSDFAMRIAGQKAADQSDPRRFWAMLAVASAHADRLEAKDTEAWVRKSIEACDAEPAACPDHERVRLDLYLKALAAANASGIDPKLDPDAFKAAMDHALPVIRVGGRGNKPPQ